MYLGGVNQFWELEEFYKVKSYESLSDYAQYKFGTPDNYYKSMGSYNLDMCNEMTFLFRNSNSVASFEYYFALFTEKNLQVAQRQAGWNLVWDIVEDIAGYIPIPNVTTPLNLFVNVLHYAHQGINTYTVLTGLGSNTVMTDLLSISSGVDKISKNSSGFKQNVSYTFSFIQHGFDCQIFLKCSDGAVRSYYVSLEVFDAVKETAMTSCDGAKLYLTNEHGFYS